MPPPWENSGSPPLTITNVKAICTAPQGARLVVVKVETSEPGLYGLGCATFSPRAQAVAFAVEEYLCPFVLGRDPADIDEAAAARHPYPDHPLNGSWPTARLPDGTVVRP